MDEAYYEYADAEDYPQTLPLLEKYENLYGFTHVFKSIWFSCFSYRICDWGCEVNRTARSSEVTIQYINCSAILALAALEDQAFLQDCVQKNAEGLNQYYAFCKEYMYSIIHLKQISFS